MITILYPELLPAIARDPLGLSVHTIEGHQTLILVIKASKEILLTAKVNQGFRMYLTPIESDGITSLAVVSAFFDDQDEPLYIFTPVFGDASSTALFRLLSSATFDVHFFDEKNIELLGYRAINRKPDAVRERLAEVLFWPASYERAREYFAKACAWFGTRTAADDAAAIEVAFEEPLFPENLFIQDLRLGALATDAHDRARYTTLERDGEPGPYQERDIIHLLCRVFSPDHVFLNPRKADDKKELTDAAAITQDNVLVIQAKDSPNTEKSLRRSIDRKRATTEGHLRKAVGQLEGTLSYLQGRETLSLISTDAGAPLEISLQGRKVWGLIILKEILEADYAMLSRPVLQLASRSGIPCLVMSYFELHQFTYHRGSETELFQELRQTFDFAVDHGRFSPNRFGFVPASQP